jgi:hypothetical protein
MDDSEKLVDKIDKIYKEIEPSLIGCAYRYKIPNPREVVKEWLSRAFIIADRFDKGELKKKVSLNKESTEVYDPELHSQEDFVASLKAYLKTAFVNDLIKQYNKRKRDNKYRSTQYNPLDPTSRAQSIDSLLDAIHLADILDIIEIDINRLQGSKTSVLDLVNQKFLEAIRTHCLSLNEDYGNFVVVQDADQVDNKKFFTEDFRDDLEDGVRKQLCIIILEEDNPMLLQKLNFLISKDKRGTLQKRLFRYFFEYHNGYPKRLRNRIKNRGIK